MPRMAGIVNGGSRRTTLLSAASTVSVNDPIALLRCCSYLLRCYSYQECAGLSPDRYPGPHGSRGSNARPGSFTAEHAEIAER